MKRITLIAAALLTLAGTLSAAPAQAAVTPILVSRADVVRPCIDGSAIRSAAVDATFRLSSSSAISYWLLQDGSQLRVDPYGTSPNLPFCSVVTPAIAIPASWSTEAAAKKAVVKRHHRIQPVHHKR